MQLSLDYMETLRIYRNFEIFASNFDKNNDQTIVLVTPIFNLRWFIVIYIVNISSYDQILLLHNYTCYIVILFFQ